MVSQSLFEVSSININSNLELLSAQKFTFSRTAVLRFSLNNKLMVRFVYLLGIFWKFSHACLRRAKVAGTPQLFGNAILQFLWRYN